MGRKKRSRIKGKKNGCSESHNIHYGNRSYSDNPSVDIKKVENSKLSDAIIVNILKNNKTRPERDQNGRQYYMISPKDKFYEGVRSRACELCQKCQKQSSAIISQISFCFDSGNILIYSEV